jgi:glycosyltransferase involved in cell wall biosynthesis
MLTSTPPPAGPMRVLYVYTGNMYGGVEALLTTLARYRDACPGLEPHYAACWAGRSTAELEGAGATVHILGGARGRDPLSILRVRRALRDVLRREPYDVVVCHSAWTQAIFGPVVRDAGRPLGFWLHDPPGDRLVWLERWAARCRPDVVVCNSRYTSARLDRIYPGVPSGVVYCPVAPAVVAGGGPAARDATRAEFGAGPGTCVILQIGRWERHKGHLAHLEGLALLGGRDWACWMVGEPQRPHEVAYRDEVRDAAERLGIADRVKLLGWQPDLGRLLAASDVYCQPNIGAEPFGITFIEALYAGLPVVGTPLGGPSEIITDEVGTLTPPGDAEALAGVLRGLIDDPSRRGRLGAAGPARARELSDPGLQIGRLRNLLDLAIAADRGEAPATADDGGRTWHILTGEYPPRAGGVADYTRLVAHGLAGAGREVHVWTSPAGDDGRDEPGGGVTVHRDAGLWSAADLRRLDARLDAFAAPRRLLVQYTPNAWGRRGLNLGFCRWLERRARDGDEVVAMVHEAIYHWQPGDRPLRLMLTAVHRLMFTSLLRASRRVLYAAASLEAQIAHHGRGRAPATLVPVPSCIPVIDDPDGVAAIRARSAPAGEVLVGHFGTYGATASEVLERSLVPLMRGRADRVALLLGRGGRAFAEGLARRHPELAARVLATGGLPAEDVSRHLQACDLLIQPYVDGVSTRRTSVMAALAHGLPVVTNSGHNTEPLWSDEEGAAVAADHAGALVAEAEALLADAGARASLGAAGADLYRRRFAPEKTIEALLQTEAVTA